MELNLSGKVIMVAASSRGLGYGIAEKVAGEGARVSIASRTETDITEAARRLADAAGAEVEPFVMDAADPDSIGRWTAGTMEKFGTVDGLVVNAGGPPAGKFDDFDDEAWAGAFNLTLMSAVRMIRSVLPVMRKQGSGSIVTVTSVAIREPIDVLLLSNVFRSGVASLVKSLSRDLAGQGIRINNLVPGRIDTDRVRSLDETVAKQEGISPGEQKKRLEAAIPAGRYGTIEEFGSAAAYLLSDAASYVTGSTLVCDGGLSRSVW